MITKNLPLVAPDTEIFGDINESNLAAAYSNIKFSSQRKVYTLNRTGGSLNIVDDTTPATSGTTDAYAPFGTNVIGTGATLKVYDSTDSVWASHELTLTAGSVTDLKSTGWKKFLFGENTNRKEWKPSYDPSTNIPSRKYIRVELNDGADNDSFAFACGTADLIGFFLNVTTAGGTSTAVKVAEIVLIRKTSDIKWVDFLSTVNGSTTTNYTPSPDTFLPIAGNETYLGFSGITEALETFLFRAQGVNAITQDVAYSRASDFAALAYTSGNNFSQTGQATLQSTATHTTSTWTAPTDWAKRALTFNLESGGSITTPALYWIRFTIATVTSEIPTQVPVYRMRARTLGDSTTKGEKYSNPITVKAINLHLRGNIIGTGAVTLSFVDLASSDEVRTRSISIPSTAVQGDYIAEDISDMIVSKPGLIYANGTRSFNDVEISIEQ